MTTVQSCANGVIVRGAEDADAEGISSLLMEGAKLGLTLRRTPAEVRAVRADFVVACRQQYPVELPAERGADAEAFAPLVYGCGAMQVVCPGLAELRSIAVSWEAKGLGIGRLIVGELLARAPELGCGRVVLLTKIPEFFERFGFERVRSPDLPTPYRQKVLLTPGRSFKGRVGMMRAVER